MNVVILDPAKDDLAESFWFYESQRHGLGHYFLDTIYSEIDTLEKNAGIHPMYDGPYYVMISDRFPFSIYYFIDSNDVFVEAVIDQRRNPKWIGERLN